MSSIFDINSVEIVENLEESWFRSSSTTAVSSAEEESMFGSITEEGRVWGFDIVGEVIFWDGERLGVGLIRI